MIRGACPRPLRHIRHMNKTIDDYVDGPDRSNATDVEMPAARLNERTHEGVPQSVRFSSLHAE